MELLIHKERPFPTQHFILALLVVSARLPHLTLASCNITKVYNGDEEVTDTVCIQEYNTTDCLKFAFSQNVSDLPEDRMTGDSVQRPGKLDVSSILKKYVEDKKIARYPQLRFSWKSPSSGSARKSIKGFYLWMQSDDGDQTECRLISIDHSNYENDQLKFQYNLEKISTEKGRNYSVRVYSLPLPARPMVISNWMRDRENYKAKIVTTKDPNFSKVQYPAYWVASITADPNMEDRSIEVSFPLPDPDLKYGFTNYTVGVVNAAKDGFTAIENGERIIYIDPSSTAETASTKFTNLDPDGWYQVYVSVKDLYRNDKDLCQCYYYNPEDFIHFRYCENSCPNSWSAIFDLNGDVTLDPLTATHSPVITSPTSPSSSPSSSQGSTPSPSGRENNSTPSVVPNNTKQSDGFDDTTLIILICVLAVAIIAFLCFVVFIRLHKKRRDSKDLINPEFTKVSSLEAPKSNLPNPYDLRPVTAYLLSSPDHDPHQDMIKHFVDFLKTHCKCDVIEPSEYNANQYTGVSSSWLVDKLTKCDVVIFLDSAGAYTRLKAFISDNGVEYRPKDMGQHGDLFNLGLRYLYGEVIEKNLNKKIIRVSLTEQRCDSYFMGKADEIVLPELMSSFVQKLHNIGPNMISSYKGRLAMMPEWDLRLPGVPQLAKTIKEVKEYEQQNPDWFSSHFEPIPRIPKLERIVSTTDSSYGSLKSDERSVTPTLGSSTNSSPTSDDLNHPGFQTNDDDDDCHTLNTYCPETESCYTLETAPSQMIDYVLGGMGDNSSSLPQEDRKNACRGRGDDNVNKKGSDQIVPPCNSSEILVKNVSIAIGNFNLNKSPGISSGISQSQREIVPPRDKSEINVDNASVAIGDFNQKKSPGNSNSSFQNKREIVPPRNKSDFYVDNLSLAIGGQNKNLNQRFSPQRDAIIKPPIEIADLKVDDTFSMALGKSNHNNGYGNGNDQPVKCSNGNQGCLKPPRDDFPVIDSDNFSQILHNANSSFKKD